MMQPTQDTDVTSSISPLSHLSNDYIAGDDVTSMGGKSISTAMTTLYLDKPAHDSKKSTKHQGLELVNSLSETSPWLLEFSKYITSAVGSKNVKMLMQLQTVYIENMSKDVNTCYTKPYRAAKLKTHINEILIFFHLYWQNINDRDNNRDQYLNKMTEILGMYFDMELKASRRGKDLPSKIAAKLFTAMVIYLDNSEKHIFRVLFRVKFMTKTYSEICSPIFRKLFDRFSGNDRCIADVSYTRNLLALKLWKKIKDDLRDKKEINELAVNILGQKSPIFSSELVKIIPKVPDFYKNGSLWLLQGNSFDLRKACDNFVRYELREDTIPLAENVGETEIINGIDIFPTQIDESQSERICPSPMKDRSKDTKVSGKKIVKKVVKLRKFKPKLPKLDPGKVVFIDLTAEIEENKQTTVKKKKKRRKEEKRKLGWLRDLQKNAKLVKQAQDSQPISEDKISESTERTGIHCLEKAEHSSVKEAWRRRTACESCHSCTSRWNGILLDRNKLYTESHVSSQSSPSKVTPLSPTNDRSCLQCEHVMETDAAHRDSFFNYGNREGPDSVVTSDYKSDRESSVVANDGKPITCDTFQNATNQSLLSSAINIEMVETSQKSQSCISSEYRAVGRESCVDSTTQSLKQPRMMPESTKQTLVNELSPELDSQQKICDETSARQLRKTVETVKHRDEGESIDVNDTLQRNLIQALSLDSIIDIPIDDNASKSDKATEELKRKRENRTYGNIMLDNDDDSFLDIPEMKLRDEFETGAGLSGTKEIVDEFENIDILDSILNGDMSMEDILDEPQQVTVNESSSNVFNFFNKFFKHSEITSKKADASVGTDEVATKSLPEGSLGITGLLNSLLDSDLTSFDLPPSDFMYSNVQTVAPRLIRRSPTLELKSNFATTSNVIVSDEQSSTKDQLFLEEKDDEIANGQLEGFTLDETKPVVFEMPVLEEELIHLPQHSLIVDTIIPSSSCESPLSAHSDSNINLIDVKPGPSISHDYDSLFPKNVCNASKSKNHEHLRTFRQSNDSKLFEQSEKLDVVTESNGAKELLERNNSNSLKQFDHPAVVSENLNEVSRHSSTEMDTVENLPTCLLTDFTPPQSVDPPQSPCTFALSPVASHVQVIPHSPTNSIGITRSSAGANLLTPPPSITPSSHRNNITPPPTPLNLGEEPSNRQLRGIASNRRRRCPPVRPQHHSDVSEIVTTSTDVKPHAQPTVARVKRNCRTKNNNIKYEIDEVHEVEESSSNFIERLSEVQLVVKSLESHEARTTGGAISLLKSSKQQNATAHLTKESQPTTNYRTQSVEVGQQMNLKKLGLTTQPNKQVLVNLNGKTKPAVVFDRNGKNMLLKMLHEESRSCSNIVYKLTPANNKPYTKLPKVNFSLKSKVESRRQSTATKRRDSIEDIDQESQRTTMVPARYPARRSKSQLSKTAKEHNVRKNLSGTNIDEEPSSKKRKMDCKLLPMVENEGLMFALASRKTQEKRSNIIRRDYGCKDRPKKTIV